MGKPSTLLVDLMPGQHSVQVRAMLRLSGDPRSRKASAGLGLLETADNGGPPAARSSGGIVRCPVGSATVALSRHARRHCPWCSTNAADGRTYCPWGARLRCRRVSQNDS